MKSQKSKYLIILTILFWVISSIRVYDEDIQNNKNTSHFNIPVLMYHHFTTNKEEVNSLIVYVEEFEAQMTYLKEQNYTALTVKELLKIIYGGMEVPLNPILITADDGYLSNYEYMYPILKKNNLKGTVFIIGQRINNANTIGLPKFTWEQAKEMYESGVMDFQSHTYNSHETIESKGIFSSPIEDENDLEYRKRIDEDMKLSISDFELNLGYKPIALAYPFGDYSEISEEVLKDNGIKLSFTINNGFVSEQNENGYLLNRIDISGFDTIYDFIRKINNN